jgi:hypothetical protein
MFWRMSSAKSYASTSGNTSVPVLSSSATSGSALSSSVAGEFLINQDKAYGKFAPMVQKGLPDYDPMMRYPGDIFFHINDGVVGHTNMTGPDITHKVDSVDSVGVRTMPLMSDKSAAIVFRFKHPAVAVRAAHVANDWANTYVANGRYKKDGVGYSGGLTAGIGITGRVIGALMGSSKFGTGAQARLMKYRHRPGMAPKNVICSEMCILAFQLSMTEKDDGFIKLDAKHALPSNLCDYMLNNPSHWELVAQR